MRTSSPTSTAGAVREQVRKAAPGTFLRRRDFAGSDRAVESALSRLASSAELVRVRKGLYWRGKQTRFGMTRPGALDVALAVAGPGSGPAGVSAAHMLGLTTQVPGTVEVAAPGKAPEPIRGVRFRSRPYSRQACKLRPMEVAVLEVLRDPGAAELPWGAVESRIAELLETDAVRRSALDRSAVDEPSPAVRARWAELVPA
jgi:hypothetical protein